MIAKRRRDAYLRLMIEEAGSRNSESSHTTEQNGKRAKRVSAKRVSAKRVSAKRVSAERVSTGPRRQVGALPFRLTEDGRIEVALVTSRETRRWVIPKGWPIRKLAPFETAAREAYEEAGLAGAMAQEPYGAYSYEKRLKSRNFVSCNVDVFLMAVARAKKRWPERDERERRWFPAEEAAQLVDEPELSDLIAALPERMGLAPSAESGLAHGGEPVEA